MSLSKRIGTVIYGLFGLGAILYGIAALLFPTGLESRALESYRFVHILREQGAAAVFVGLMSFWCIFNYERRRAVHYFLMVFTLLLAVIHWHDYFSGRRVFARKRNLMVNRLADMGIRCAREPQGTFYCWASIKDLPPPLNDADAFFFEGLKHKVMTVPGVFFDVNPGKRRPAAYSFKSWVRFSFGPPEDNVREGLNRLEKMIGNHSR